jgi:hypothetical protein
MEPVHTSSPPPDYEVDFSPPPDLRLPLWRSLLRQVCDRGEQLPPLETTAKPVNVGMLLGDSVSIPWYRTVFSNIGDVITPETAPPLQLESHPVEGGELISDQIQRGWWTSLLRNLADWAAPEKMPPLHLTAAPVNPETASGQLLVPRWSSLVAAPAAAPAKLSSVAAARIPIAPPRVIPLSMAEAAESIMEADSSSIPELISKAQRTLRFSRIREGFWIAVACAEALLLIFWLFVQK